MKRTKKRISTMRIAALIMVMAMASSCFVGGTFAKYISTSSATSTAVVAKWGVKIEAEDNGAFSKQYDADDANITVAVESDRYVVAPGTKGSVDFKVTGTPEVASKIKFDITPVKDVHLGDYYPIRYTLTGTLANGMTQTLAEGNSASALLADLKDSANFIGNSIYVSGLDNTPGSACDAVLTLSWEWPFDGDNERDTILGEVAAGTASNADACIDAEFAFNITVTQIN